MVVPVAARRITHHRYVENEQAAAGNGGGGGSSRAAGCTEVGARNETQKNEVGEGWGWVGVAGRGGSGGGRAPPSTPLRTNLAGTGGGYVVQRETHRTQHNTIDDS